MIFFVIPLVVMVVTQAIKLVIEGYRGTFAWSHVNSYGGMPSSHAALVTSLSTVIGVVRGIDTPEFAISVVVLVITLRDAMGFRFQLGIHGKILNQLIQELPEREEYKFPILSERLGHTPAEVTVGVLAGIIGTIILIPFFPI